MHQINIFSTFNYFVKSNVFSDMYLFNNILIEVSLLFSLNLCLTIPLRILKNWFSSFHCKSNLHYWSYREKIWLIHWLMTFLTFIDSNYYRFFWDFSISKIQTSIIKKSDVPCSCSQLLHPEFFSLKLKFCLIDLKLCNFYRDFSSSKIEPN